MPKGEYSSSGDNRNNRNRQSRKNGRKKPKNTPPPAPQLNEDEINNLVDELMELEESELRDRLKGIITARDEAASAKRAAEARAEGLQTELDKAKDKIKSKKEDKDLESKVSNLEEANKRLEREKDELRKRAETAEQKLTERSAKASDLGIDERLLTADQLERWRKAVCQARESRSVMREIRQECADLTDVAAALS